MHTERVVVVGARRAHLEPSQKTLKNRIIKNTKIEDPKNFLTTPSTPSKEFDS
jgi:hypothetical protein